MKKILNQLTKVDARPIDKPIASAENSTGNVFIKTLNVFLTPAKSRYHQFYHPKNNWWFWHLTADIILVLAITGLFGLNIFLLTYPNKNTVQNYFDTSLLAINKQPHLTLELVKDRDNIKNGENLTYTINYKNDGSAPATDLMLILTLESELLNGSKKIILDATKYPDLKTVSAGTAGSIKYQTSLNTKVEQLTNPNNYIMTSVLEATYKNPQNNNQEINITSNRLIQKVTTNLLISAVAKYRLNEGDQLGVGPLPPVVGQTTKYWIFLAAETDYNDASNISVTASLPANVRPTGRISATSPQPVKFDLTNNQVSWQVETIVAPSSDYPQVGTAFEVTLTPTKDQVGKPAALLTTIKASGQDKFTGAKLVFDLNDLNTKIIDDSSGGLVQ